MVGREVKWQEIKFPGYAGSLPAKSAAARCGWREAQVILLTFSGARGSGLAAFAAAQAGYLRTQGAAQVCGIINRPAL